ncbi:ribonucleoside-diphosphate reductase subunit alpha [Bdellovibrio bacteriovorus]|uniref:ribonucleoside-diphosphate reductase subunit alpha n=1 Tax=Bdellovibrio bacteriovorus TaxID=959 RepID=UPI0021CEFEF2|nr:ribonucleoside-diphosphate reductase subunit alpha [Bdellovibrio bacteriovorus]UXR63554.1 ribonucleoside-diphosphate reductase subunit alpha [Bdellovibrio bacteriovorus]
MLETTAHIMRVKKRDGTLEPVDVTKIVERVTKNCQGLTQVDPLRVATKAISGLYDGASTKELDNLCIQTASLLIGEDPEYSRLAARLLSTYIDEEVRSQKIQSFADSVSFGFQAGLLAESTYKFVEANKAALCAAIEPYRTDRFEYFGLRTVYDRYLLKNPTSRQVFETPQYFFMRVACGLAQSVEEAIEFYRLISSHDYMPSTPTLFNSGTMRPQMSSCYLLDSPSDDLSAIYQKYTDIALLSKFAGGIGDIALLSKFAGGIGVAYSRVRSRGSLIKGTNGHSNGIIPWLKTMDSSVAAVNQGGKRKGAACVYLETWHGDIEEFLELRDNTGDEAKRAHNLNLANWVPDLFMKRVEADAMWSLFDPKVVPHFVDTYGEEFEKAYAEAEEKKLYIKQIKARDLYSRMMKTLAQTGNGWMTFKDHANLKANQTGEAGNVIHLSNLCTEILEVTSDKETAVCNLGSVNLARHVENGQFNFEKLARSVRTAVKYLDRVVDINFYPIQTAQDSNHKWRPVGLGVMGLQDALFLMKLPFDSAAARDLSAKVQEEIYYNALVTSCELAEQLGPHGAYEQTKAAKGLLQYDLWGVTPSQPERFEKLKEKIKKHGLRNSLMIAIAPTATIASIVGCYEAIEPQVSNLFKRETLSGEFMQINKYLVSDLKAMGIWTEDVRNEIKLQDGSIQDVAMIPPQIKELYRTVWEIPMKSLVDMAADRGAYIDQAQSLNLFQESPTIGKLSSMYMYAWKKGVKTTYYLRSRPATKIAKTTVKASGSTVTPNASEGGMDAAPAQETTAKKTYSDAEVIACSLENPEACEACQ